MVTEVISLFLELTVHRPVIKEVLSQDRLNPTLVHGLLRYKNDLQRTNAGGWDYIDQVP